MNQYHRLFNTCRTPGLTRDKLHFHFKTGTFITLRSTYLKVFIDKNIIYLCTLRILWQIVLLWPFNVNTNDLSILWIHGVVGEWFLGHLWCDPGGVHPYLGMVGRFRGDDPRVLDFQSDWVPILYINIIRLTPSFGRKNRFVSITFSSRDIRT